MHTHNHAPQSTAADIEHLQKSIAVQNKILNRLLGKDTNAVED